MDFRALALAFCVMLPTSVNAATFTLNFSNGTFPDFGLDNANLSVDFDSVATVNGDVINAQLTGLSPWIRNNTNNNLVEQNAVQVNAQRGQTAQLQFTLFDDAVGDGYTSVYDPGVSFDWALTFFDLDGTATTWDQVLLITPGSAEFAQDSLLSVVQTNQGLLFSGEDTVGNVSNSVAAGGLTAAQQQHAVRYLVQDRSTVRFDYTSFATEPSTNGRNLIFDGGTLEIDNPLTVTVTPVPLPAGAPLLLAGLGAMFGLRRRAA